jgi:hypothetical protein
VVVFGGRGGVTRLAPGPGFARPTHRKHGNQLPAGSGIWLPEDDKEGPGPHNYPGYMIGGTAGGGDDGYFGADPRSPQIQPTPVFLPGSNAAGMDSGTANNDNSYRGGLQGFNDKLTVTDRHAYWDQGRPQRQGTDFTAASSPPNTYNNPQQEPPVAELRTVNRRWSYQKGSDASRNQDDLSRPYTWLGEQGSGYAPVYGGTPGLYVPYGSRGGVPYPVVDPTGGTGGPEKVWSGPPHGLHSLTYPSGGDTLSRYGALPQMRPVRVDHPSNSPQAGQAYSQIVQVQGGPARTAMAAGAAVVHHTGRGWAGGGAWLA